MTVVAFLVATTIFGLVGAISALADEDDRSCPGVQDCRVVGGSGSPLLGQPGTDGLYGLPASAWRASDMGTARQHASNAETVVATVLGQGLDARDADTAVMVGITESNLGNPPGGDRDSGGFFQQRPSSGRSASRAAICGSRTAPPGSTPAGRAATGSPARWPTPRRRR